MNIEAPTVEEEPEEISSHLLTEPVTTDFDTVISEESETEDTILYESTDEPEPEKPETEKVNRLVQLLDKSKEVLESYREKKKKRAEEKAAKAAEKEKKDPKPSREPLVLIRVLVDFFGKIGAFCSRLADIMINVLLFPIILPWRIAEGIEKILNSEGSLGEKIQPIAEKIRKVLDFIGEDSVKHTFTVGKKHIFALIRHYVPRKVKGSLRYGLDDPAMTGKIYGGYCMAARWHHYKVRLIPEFDKAVIDGDIHISGHIRLVHILFAGIKLILIKDVRITIKKAMRLAKSI